MLQRCERPLRDEDDPRGRSRRGAGVLGRDEYAPRSGRERRRREPAAVDVGPWQADEQRTGAGFARVDDDALESGALALAAARVRLRAWHVRQRDDQPSLRGLGDSLRGPVLHVRLKARERSTSRATATSSNGTLRPAASSWPCS